MKYNVVDDDYADSGLGRRGKRGGGEKRGSEDAGQERGRAVLERLIAQARRALLLVRYAMRCVRRSYSSI